MLAVPSLWISDRGLPGGKDLSVRGPSGTGSGSHSEFILLYVLAYIQGFDVNVIMRLWTRNIPVSPLSQSSKTKKVTAISRTVSVCVRLRHHIALEFEVKSRVSVELSNRALSFHHAELCILLSILLQQFLNQLQSFEHFFLL